MKLRRDRVCSDCRHFDGNKNWCSVTGIQRSGVMKAAKCRCFQEKIGGSK